MQPSLLWNATRAHKNIPVRQWKPPSLIKHGTHKETKRNQIHHWFCPNQLSREKTRKIFTLGLKETTSSPPAARDTKKQNHHCYSFLPKYPNPARSSHRLWKHKLQQIDTLSGRENRTYVLVTTLWQSHSHLNPAVCVLLPVPCPSYFITDHNLIRLKLHWLGTEPEPFSCFTGLFLKL